MSKKSKRKQKRKEKNQNQAFKRSRNEEKELNDLINDQYEDQKYSGQIFHKQNPNSQDIFDRRRRSGGSGFKNS